MEVRDLVLHPPGTDPYNVLKDTLIKRTAASEQRCLQQLFQAEELGDRKPTQLLRCMQQLLGDRTGLDESFLKGLFLQRLPNNVRMVLAASPSTTPLESLTELANRVTEVANPPVDTINTPSTSSNQPPPVAQVTGKETHQPTSADFEKILSELAKLQATVKSLTRERGRAQRSRSRHRSPTPNPPSSATEFCWYHQKYGDEARKCNPPCSHPNAPARR